ncbi:MAG: NUDIX hydrolase [Actinobacteria bacterium]|nr:NUDIX hydrolase [Actinomycetota bacterium]
MTIVPPEPGEPRRPHGPLNSGDAWVVAPTGERYWGRYGAAGLLAVDRERGVLLQHRVAWSHHGGTWALPGGALHEGESAREGAIREAQEEAGVPDGSVRARFESVLDLGIWSYTTVVADVVEPFEPVISDPESLALQWVPVDEVDALPLHPGFAAAWPQLRALLDVRPAVVIDAANVVGSVPDGWWKDRAGATGRLRDGLDAWARRGIPAERVALDSTRWHPRVVLVAEGAAREVSDPADSGDVACAVQIVRAPAAGDDAIVAVAAEHAAAGDRVFVVTSDRGLAARIDALTGVGGPAEVRSVRWLLDQLDDVSRSGV